MATKKKVVPEPAPEYVVQKISWKSVIVQWLIIIGVIAACFYWHWWPKFGTMTSVQVLFFALSFGFLWVDVMKWGATKPFNCIKCMTGWAAVALAFIFHVEFWYFYLPGGLLTGAMFEGIRMRWL